MKNLLLFRGNDFDANFYYHSGMDVDNSFYLKTGSKEILFVPKLNERAAREAFKGNVIAYQKPLAEMSKLIKNKELFLDYSAMPAKIYDKLRRIARTKDASEELFKLRAKKKPVELEKIRKAVSITKKLFAEFENQDFKDESQAANWLLIRTFELGLKPAFDPIVGSGKHSAFPHYKFAHSKMGDFALVDYGVRYGNYCADVSRVIFRKKNKEASEAYAKAKYIFYEIIDSMADFETGKDLALFSEAQFKRYKLPAPIHSIGHGVGLDIHEYPRLNKRFSDQLKGAVMAIEPAAYFKDFGVRFEETIYFDGKKAKVL